MKLKLILHDKSAASVYGADIGIITPETARQNICILVVRNIHPTCYIKTNLERKSERYISAYGIFDKPAIDANLKLERLDFGMYSYPTSLISVVGAITPPTSLTLVLFGSGNKMEYFLLGMPIRSFT